MAGEAEDRTTFEGELVAFEPELPVGFHLSLQGVRIPSVDAPLQTHLIYQDFEGALLSLNSVTSDGSHVHGTAFMVAPGIAMTAAHTLRAWSDAGHYERSEHALFATGICGSTLRTWQVRELVVPEAGDVAVLVLIPRFDLKSGANIVYFELTANLPALGSRVLVLGTRASSPEGVYPFDENGDFGFMGVNTVASSGRVLDHYLQGLPHNPAPCFGADFVSIGGMSGGPVFDERGFVVGLVTSSLESATLEEWVTFTSLCWPATLMKLSPVWPPQFLETPFQLAPEWVDEGWRIRGTEGGGMEYRLGGEQPSDEARSPVPPGWN